MKIALPTNGENLEAEVDPHFGRTQNYLIYDAETKKFEIYPNPEAMGGKELPPEFLNRLGVNIVIVFGLGPKAFDKFEELGIKIYKAVEKNIVGNIKEFQEGALDELKKEKFFN